MKDKVLAYIESPAQLVNAYDLYNKESVTYVVRDNGRSKNIAQIDELACHFQLDNYRLRSFKVYKIFNYLWLIKDVLKNDVIVVGDLRSKISILILFISRIFKKKVAVVDDGLYLVSYLKIQKNIQRLRKINNLTIFSNFCDKLEGLNVLLPNNELQYNRKKDVDIFLGQKICEMGFLDIESYIRCVEKAAALVYPKTLFYIPHRDEGAKVFKSENIICYSNLKFPVEIIASMEEWRIVNIYGFYSTAILNLFNKNRDAIVNVFVLNPVNIIEKYKFHIDSSYMFLKKMIPSEVLNEKFID